MSTAPMFDPYGNQPQRDKRPRNWLATCLVGCLVMAVLMLAIAGLAVYWLSQNWRGVTSELATAIIGGALDASQLPPQERQEILEQVDRLAKAFRDRAIPDEQTARIIQEIVQSPLVTMIIVSGIDRAYFETSGLSEAEQAEGRKTVQRFLRGTIDGTIDRDSMDAALAHVADRQQDRSWRLRSRVTDEQLRAFLAAAKTKADEANVPEAPPDFDPSNELKRIVDRALNEPAELEEPIDTEAPAAADEPDTLNQPVEIEERPARVESAEAR